MVIVQVLICGLLALLVGAATSHIAEAIMAKRKLALPVCPYCQTPYERSQWSALVALALGKGKCTHCEKPLRKARWVGELYLVVFWIVLMLTYGLTLRTLYAMLTLIPLAMIMVTDLESKLVPHRITFPAIGAMLVLGLLFGPALPGGFDWRWYDSLLGAVVAAVILQLFIWFGEIISGPGALGGGDMTLSTYIGAVVGFPMIIEALILGILFGGVGAVLVLVSRKGNLKTAVPYGPFLILGGTVALIWGQAILTWYMS